MKQKSLWLFLVSLACLLGFFVARKPHEFAWLNISTVLAVAIIALVIVYLMRTSSPDDSEERETVIQQDD